MVFTISIGWHGDRHSLGHGCIISKAGQIVYRRSLACKQEEQEPMDENHVKSKAFLKTLKKVYPGIVQLTVNTGLPYWNYILDWVVFPSQDVFSELIIENSARYRVSCIPDRVSWESWATSILHEYGHCVLKNSTEVLAWEWAQEHAQEFGVDFDEGMLNYARVSYCSSYEGIQKWFFGHEFCPY